MLQLELLWPPGELTSASQLALRFSQAMFALGARPQAPPGVSLDPEMPGTWHWVDTETLVFTPHEPFAKATTYVVHVSADVLAPSGDQEGTEQRYTFTTRPPAVTAFRPWGHHEGLNPELVVTFASPIDPKVAATWVRLGDVPLQVGASNDPHELVLRPTTPLEPDTVYVVRIHGAPRDYSFKTRGESEAVSQGDERAGMLLGHLLTQPKLGLVDPENAVYEVHAVDNSHYRLTDPNGELLEEGALVPGAQLLWIRAAATWSQLRLHLMAPNDVLFECRLQVAHLSLTVFWDQEQAIALVTDRAGRPVYGAEIDGRVTDERGLAPVNPSLDPVVARYGTHEVFVPRKRPTALIDRMRWFVCTDRARYEPGDRVAVLGWVRQLTPAGATLEPPEPWPLRWSVHGGRSTAPRARGSVDLTSEGGFLVEFDLPLGGETLRLETANQIYQCSLVSRAEKTVSAPRESRLALRLAQTPVVGEAAQVLVRSPVVPGEGVLRLVCGGMLLVQHFRVDAEETTVEFTPPAGCIGPVRLIVDVISGLTLVGGELEVCFDRSGVQLDVELQAQDEWLVVTVKRGGEGVSGAEVALVVGHVEDPGAVMYGGRVNGTHLRSSLELLGTPNRWELESGARCLPSRGYVPPPSAAAGFVARLKTDAAGQARVARPTRVARLTALAAHRACFGRAELTSEVPEPPAVSWPPREEVFGTSGFLQNGDREWATVPGLELEVELDSATSLGLKEKGSSFPRKQPPLHELVYGVVHQTYSEAYTPNDNLLLHLLQTRPHDPLLVKLVRGLRAGDPVGAYLRALEPAGAAFAAEMGVGERVERTDGRERATWRVRLDGTPLRLSHRGEGRLYYRLRWRLPSDSGEAFSAGLSLRRVLHRGEGDRLMTLLYLLVPRPYGEIRVETPLAPGMEIVEHYQPREFAWCREGEWNAVALRAGVYEMGFIARLTRPGEFEVPSAWAWAGEAWARSEAGRVGLS
jgi:hypothetical protein